MATMVWCTLTLAWNSWGLAPQQCLEVYAVLNDKSMFLGLLKYRIEYFLVCYHTYRAHYTCSWILVSYPWWFLYSDFSWLIVVLPSASSFVYLNTHWFLQMMITRRACLICPCKKWGFLLQAHPYFRASQLTWQSLPACNLWLQAWHPARRHLLEASRQSNVMWEEQSSPQLSEHNSW